MKSATSRFHSGRGNHETELGRNGEKGIVVSGCLLNSPAVMAFVAIPSEVTWSYFAFGVVIAIGLVTIFVRGDWQKARGFDRLILFGPLFYAAPLAAFGTEHLTLYRRRAEPGDEDSAASRGEFAGFHVFPFRGADGHPGVGARAAKPVCAGARAAAITL